MAWIYCCFLTLFLGEGKKKSIENPDPPYHKHKTSVSALAGMEASAQEAGNTEYFLLHLQHFCTDFMPV